MARAASIESVVLGAPAVILGILTVVFPAFALGLLVGLLIIWIAAAAILMDRRLRARVAAQAEAAVHEAHRRAAAAGERPMEASPMDDGAATPPPQEAHAGGPTNSGIPNAAPRERGQSLEAQACNPGPHEIRAGHPVVLELIAFRGDKVSGTVREKDGYDFSVFIVDRPNRAKYLEDPEHCAKLFRKAKAAEADVEFRVPDSAELPCYLVL